MYYSELMAGVVVLNSDTILLNNAQYFNSVRVFANK